MPKTFEEYRHELERISGNLRDEAAAVALMLLYVERQVPSCIGLQRRLQISLQYLFTVIDQLWSQVLSRTLTSDQLTAIKQGLLSMASISNVVDARSALPTVGVALNTCDAVLMVTDFLLRSREDGFILCAQSCLEAVREEIHQELHLNLVATKGPHWVLAERNSIEYSNAITRITRLAFGDERTQAEIAAQLALAEKVLCIPGGDRIALFQTRQNALSAGVNGLGFG